MTQAAIWRSAAVVMLAALLVAKFLVLGPVPQTSLTTLNNNLAAMLERGGASDIQNNRQARRADVRQFQFNLAGCNAPVFALQALTLEDPQALLDAAQPLPASLNPHVFYLGHELSLDDRLGLKLVAVQEFLRFRLGYSKQAPAAYIYIVMAPPDCVAYRNLDWQQVWAN